MDCPHCHGMGELCDSCGQPIDCCECDEDELEEWLDGEDDDWDDEE